MKKPIVSVCIITYNHVKYIRQAIDSVLSQEVNFSWEIIIADDCSIDGTADIVGEYAKKHSNLIKIISREKNIGAESNFIEVMKSAKGKYIAYLEGDDYWSHPNKLQKQVEILDGSSEFNACFHNVAIIDSYENSLGNVYQPNYLKSIKIQNLLEGHYMKSCSILFKNDHELLEPIFSRYISADDTSLGYCLLSKGQNGIYIDEIMATYRVHAGGIWSPLSLEQRNKWIVDDFKLKYHYFFNNPIMKSGVKKILLQNLKTRIIIDLKKLKPVSALKYALQFIGYKYFNFR